VLALLTGDLACGLVGDRLPPLPEWGLWRSDPVWACNPGPLMRFAAVGFPELRRWPSLDQCGGVRFARFYKSKEARHPVELPAASSWIHRQKCCPRRNPRPQMKGIFSAPKPQRLRQVPPNGLHVLGRHDPSRRSIISLR
jgi:hypothetical protein